MFEQTVLEGARDMTDQHVVRPSALDCSVPGPSALVHSHTPWLKSSSDQLASLFSELEGER